MNKLKSAVLAATTIAVALSVGFATPATAMPMTIESNVPSIERDGEAVVITSSVPDGYAFAVFINEDLLNIGPWDSADSDPVPWEALSPCVTIDLTFRVYRDIYVDQVRTFDDAYGASVTVEWIGDDTVDCNPTWGTGESAASGESLADTGSDGFVVAGLTGVAGVAALAVAVAVARRTRRAQR
jgi:hypothetical protein